MNILTHPYRNLNFLSSLILGGYFIFGLLIYMPNMGGTGLRLPQNIICWGVMLLIILMAGYCTITRNKFKWNNTCTLFVIGSFLISLPLLWSNGDPLLFSLPRFAGLWGGVIFYVSLLQIPLSISTKKRLAIIIILSATIQSLLGIWQLNIKIPDNFMEFTPGGRPYGIFQQTNVLASFVSTGFACTLWLLFQVTRKHWCFVLILLTAIFSFILDILQSRAGIYGILFYSLFICLIRYRPKVRGVFVICIVVVMTTLFSIHLIKYLGLGGNFLQLVGTVNKEGSNIERWMILKSTIAMIQQHPLSGWGYGSYEVSLSRFALHHFNYLFGRVDNAHNEIMYEWVEGGILAVAGMITIVIGYGCLLCRYSSDRLAMWGLVIPIAFHLMVEYPLLLSTPHWMLLLLLCRLATSEQVYKHREKSVGIGIMISTVAVAGLLFMLTGFHTSTLLTKFERNKMQDFTALSGAKNPWIQWERWQYDRHTALLMRFNHTREPALLTDYAQWGISYLQYRNDPRVFKNLLSINHAYPLPERTKWLQEQWQDYYWAKNQ